MKEIFRRIRSQAVITLAALATTTVAASPVESQSITPRTTGGGGPGTSCTCYVDGFQTECPMIDTTGFPQADCGYLGDEIGGGGGAPGPDDFPPDLTPLGRFFFFGRPSGGGSCVPATTFEPGDPYCAQIVMINQGGLDTSGDQYEGLVIDQGGSKVVPGVVVRIFLQPTGSGLGQVDLGQETIDFPLVPRTGLEAPTPVLLNVAGQLPPATPPGGYRLGATVDVTDVLPEVGGDNNSKQADPDEAITVAGEGPDLASVSGSGAVTGFGKAGGAPTLGQSYRVTSRVRNEGSAPISGTFEVTYVATVAGGDELAVGVRLGRQSFTLEGLEPQAVRTVTFNSAAGLRGLQPKVRYELRATLDRGSETLEERRLIGTFTVAASGSTCNSLVLDAKVDGVGRKVKHVGQPFTFSAEVSPPQCANLPLHFSWNFGDGGSASGQTATHTYSTPGSRTATVSVSCFKCPFPGKTTSTGVTAVPFDFEIAKPSGDPATAGVAGINQITFSGADGQAVIAVEATIDPASAGVDAAKLLRWSLIRRRGAFVIRATPPGTTSNLWASADPTSKLGLGLTNTLTLRGYPAENGDFGPWEVRLTVEQGGVSVHRQTPVELFFERNRVADGHTAPNWFRYWLEAYRKGHGDEPRHSRYGGSRPGVAGSTPALESWSYQQVLTATDKLRIVVYDDAATELPTLYCPGAHNLKGIEHLFATLDHERRHLEQIRVCDAQLWRENGFPLSPVGSSAFVNGWSWDTVPINHFAVGPNSVAGAAGDDDGDGVADPTGLFGANRRDFLDELGCPATDDVQLFDASNWDWCTDLGNPPVGAVARPAPLLCPQRVPPPPPPPTFPVTDAIEIDACNHEQASYPAAVKADWANPGRQH